LEQKGSEKEYTVNNKKSELSKRKLVIQPKISAFSSKCPTKITLANPTSPDATQQPPNDASPIRCWCPEKYSDARNFVTCDASHIQNLGQPYLYCSRKALKPVGVSIAR
jgi:hypothetical protein